MRLIDVDALKKTLDDVCVGICNCCSAFDSNTWRCSLIDHAPTVDAAPVRHGVWFQIGDTDEWECSICRNDEVCFGYTPLEADMNYCPYCGARMDGDSA